METQNPPLNNAHIHIPPNFSAFATIAQATEQAATEGIRALGVSNYYDFTAYTEFAERCAAGGISPLYGLEIITLDEELLARGVKVNDPGNPGKYYLCGKGITRFAEMTDEATELLSVIRRNDSERMAEMTERLEEFIAAHNINTGLDAEKIRESVARRNNCPVETVYLQERHLALAFQEAIFQNVASSNRPSELERLFGAPSKNADDAGVVQGEIRSYLMKARKPAFVTETFVDFDHAYRLILALGGIPCYPTLADGASPLCGYEADSAALIADLKSHGVYAAEFIPTRNTPEVLSHYVHAFRDAGIIVTAGTEHNTPDRISLVPTCLKGEPVPDDVQTIFWEGVCVLAAHQELTASGKPGFVDSQGKLDADYATEEERISAFARLGAAVIPGAARSFGLKE